MLCFFEEKTADEFLAEMMRLVSEYTPGDTMDKANALRSASSKLDLGRLIEQRCIAGSHDAKVLIERSLSRAEMDYLHYSCGNSLALALISS